MSSHSKRIGDIGEASIIANLLQYENIHLSKPFGDNCPYDLIIDVDGKLYRTQIKTTEKVKNGKMEFSVCSNNPWKIKRNVYTRNDVDLFAFYCVENNYCGLADVDEVGDVNFTIRIDYPKSGRKIGINLAKDYDLHKRVKAL